MISTEECRKHLGEGLTDKQVEDLRDALYTLVENVLDYYIDSCARVEPICKKQLSTVEYPQRDKRTKVMD